MPLVALLIVLLTVALMLLSGFSVIKDRLSDYGQAQARAQAAAAADAVTGRQGQDLQRALDSSARASGGQVLLISDEGRVTAQGGPRLLEPPQEILRAAATGDRLIERVGNLQVATAPVILEDGIGGVVVVAEEQEETLRQLFLNSWVEAAGIASVLGGGLMLLLATLLSRRVERLTFGVRSIQQGDLSYRLKPGFDDELGELAETFNAMAAELQSSFVRLEERGVTLDTILGNLAEGVLAVNRQGRVVFANAAARSMLGTSSQEQLEELPSPWRDLNLPEAVARCAEERCRVEARVDGGGSFLHVRLEHLAKFDDGRGGVLVVLQDLSEGRRVEANQQRFLANAAHELRTPLTTIVGAAELLLSEDEEDPELRRRFLNHILSQARRMQRLSDTMLRLARTGVDLREPRLEVLDVNAVAREATERMTPLAEAAGLRLSLEDRGGLVEGDREWLEQALVILLSNAIKYSGRGGRVRLRAEGGTIAVEDEGEGIGEADLPHVFERFYRGGGGSGGSGLGLPICKELVERMGGKISIHSEEGVGTTVTIELPGPSSEEPDTGS